MTARPRRRVQSVLGFFALTVVFQLTEASAGAAPPSDGVDYNATFQQGLTAYDAGNFVGAAQIWEQLLMTLGEERGFKVAYNLGLAYQKLGDATRAVARFETFVRGANEASDPGLLERRQDATDRVAAIKATHGALESLPSPGGQVVLVRVGTADPRSAGFTLYLAPGVHEVEIGAGTVDARVAQVTLIAGKKTTITAEVLPPTKVEPPTLPRQVAPRPRSFPSAWLVGGAAVSLAAMALPLAFAVDAKNKRDAADTLGAGSTGYPDAVDRFNDARTRYALSWAVPGALALATAAVVLVKILSEPPKTEHAWDRSWARVAF